jgi:hypothetical protein
MPCRDDYGPSTVSQETYDILEGKERATQRRADLATRVACEIEKLLTKGQFDTLSEEAQKWIKKHREADVLERKREEERLRREQEDKRRKEAREKLRLTALKKLSKEEREALGLPHPAINA